MRLNDLAAIPIPPPANRPASEFGALTEKAQSTGSLFGNQPKEVDIVSFCVQLHKEFVDDLTGVSDAHRSISDTKCLLYLCCNIVVPRPTQTCESVPDFTQMFPVWSR